MTELTAEETDSIKKSYLNIVGMLLAGDNVPDRYLRCLLKWGIQLKLRPEDLRGEIPDPLSTVSQPQEKFEKVEAIYHLVHMICLDQVVEDTEIEVAGLYAQSLGLRPALVGDLLKSIITADGDGQESSSVREQVMDFLKTNSDWL